LRISTAEQTLEELASGERQEGNKQQKHDENILK